MRCHPEVKPKDPCHSAQGKPREESQPGAKKLQRSFARKAGSG